MHFTPGRNWMNDPNGLVYFRGLFHMFFQYNPHGNDWGNMSWGHASSPDLVHWTQHPLAISHGEGEQIYSGSVVVDHDNSSGVAPEGGTPLVAVYTSAYDQGKQAQSIAYSNDDGMTWTRFEGNPVLDRESTAFRDPKVFRHDGHWVMVAVEAEAREVVIYRSDDLKQWTLVSTFGQHGSIEGVWECPDLFELAIDGDEGNTTWVLIVSVNPGGPSGGSATQYFVGDFDGTRFSASSTETRWFDWGPDFYAAVSFDNAPDARRIVLGWMSNWDYAAAIPTAPWRGSMSLPRELALTNRGGVVTLVQKPVAELSVLDDDADRVELASFGLWGARDFAGAPRYRLEVTFECRDGTEFGLDLFVGERQKTLLRYDVETQRLRLDRTGSGVTNFHPSFASIDSVDVPLLDDRLQLEIWVDHASLEVFAQGGTAAITQQVFAAANSTGLSLRSFGGSTHVTGFELTPLTEAKANDTVTVEARTGRVS